MALDAHSLDALRTQAKRNPEQALKAASIQFEAVFLQTLFKSMRDATTQDGLLDSEQTRMYTSMLDQQMAQSLSVRGIGLADVMLRQLRRGSDLEAARQPTVALPAEIAPVVSAKASHSSVAPTPIAKVGDANAISVDTSSSFVSRMKTHAVEASKMTGIPVDFLIGQAALESGWGSREIRAVDGNPSYNLFGIKAGRHWKGATVDIVTTEYAEGVPGKTVQKFRAYPSYAEAFRDYASLIQGNPRYASALKQGDSAAFAQELQRAGYATDPRYAEKLTQVLNSARLRQAMVA